MKLPINSNKKIDYNNTQTKFYKNYNITNTYRNPLQDNDFSKNKKIKLIIIIMYNATKKYEK